MGGASGIGVQDAIVFAVVALAVAWLVWRQVRKRRARAALGDAAPVCDSCPGCQAMGVSPEEAEAHVRAGAAGPNPEATAAKRVIRLSTGTEGPGPRALR
jgi:hypothetical protein